MWKYMYIFYMFYCVVLKIGLCDYKGVEIIILVNELMGKKLEIILFLCLVWSIFECIYIYVKMIIKVINIIDY